MKLYQAAALALLLSTTAASACENLKVGAEAVAFGMMRGQPRLDGKPLWKLGNGVKVIFCGETRTDARGIEWLWVTTQWAEEPWGHNGWISSRIVERNVPTITAVPNDVGSPNWEPTTTPHSTMPTKPADPWTSLVSEVAAISAQQNRGVPKHSRFCEPKYQSCTDSLEYSHTNGTVTGLVVRESPGGEVFERSVCELNETLDVRTCTNFDTKEKTTSMKDVNGVWQTIAESSDGEVY